MNLHKSGLSLVFAGFAVLSSTSARAGVVDLADNGFEVQETVHIAAPPDRVYESIIVPGRWWNSDHSFSGNAANMTLDAKAGGCWCEALPGGGSALHMIVVYALPGKTLRLRGALGPFQSLAVDGVLNWSLKGDATGTDVTLDYRIGGYAKGGFADLSQAADGVLRGQVERLKTFVETGSPDTRQENKR